MSGLLIRTQSLIEDCEAFLIEKDALGSAIESYLVQHALVVMCAEIQQEICLIAEKRAAEISDSQIESFVGSASRRILRSVMKEELSSFVGHFGKEVKDKFNELCEDRTVTTYNNAVRNRHRVAHRSGAQVTLRELNDAKDAAFTLLDAVNTSIRHSE